MRAIALMVCGGLCAGLAPPAMPVDLELVIATDVSPSIDRDEARLQREGIASAFSNKQVVDAILSGSLGRIAVAAIDFSSREYNRIVVDWRIIEDESGAAAFSEALRKAPATPGQHTSISDALELAQRMIETNAFEGTKRVIDVSGDGPNNWGRQTNLVRDEAIAKGIVINGLPILGSSTTLEAYYRNCVIGGPGAFLVVASGFADFARAIRSKLIQEIAGGEGEHPAHPLLLKTAAPAVPRGGYSPPPNAQGCENQFGGFGPFTGFDFPLPLPGR